MLFILIAIGLYAIWSKKYLLMIPIIFSIAYGATQQIPSYFGYAIEAKYIGDKEVLVISTFGDHYILGFMEGENIPRLIYVDKIEPGLLEKLSENRTAIIEFRGDGVIKTNGEYVVINLEESKTFSKEVD